MIRFPTMHIAESVMNRIMNAIDGDTPLGIVSPQEPPITPPDPSAIGEQIEVATATPVPEVTLPDSGEELAAAEAAVTGGSPFDGMLMNGFGGV
jgi:hypothetical protein